MKIAIHRSWLEGEEGITRELMTRVAGVVSGFPAPQHQKFGYDWALDGTNDWWAEVRDGKLTVAYRYEAGHQEAMEALRVFLTWILGPSPTEEV